ncbi:hypothetical protein KPL70_026207 [Citrus sinensis]|nr:hypothetical protein KPL70_026207 [Citrus sinensis]
MAKLPQDIFTDTLSRLPIESGTSGKICRVLLTTSPLQSIDYRAFGFGDLRNGNVTLQLGYPGKKIPEDDATIIGSCNGMVCIYFDSTNMVLWNLSTRVSREFSMPDPFPEQDDFSNGFGYDIFGDDYKVIRCFISTIGNGNVSRETKLLVFFP